MFYKIMTIKNDFKKGSDYIRSQNKKIFNTQDGQIARKLNKTAQLRDPQDVYYRKPCAGFYPEASEEDLRILLSEKQSDILKKCTYINPETLKDYNILLKHKNPDGTLTVRILDGDGAFIKEAKIKPKNVVVIDGFKNGSVSMTYDNQEYASHGDVVKRLIQRSNPFNNYRFIDASVDENIEMVDPEKALKKLIKRIDQGEKVDILSCSFASEVTYEELERVTGQKIKNRPMAVQKKIILDALEKYSKMDDEQIKQYLKKHIKDYTSDDLHDVKILLEKNRELKLYEELSKRGVKIFFGGGNKTAISTHVNAKKWKITHQKTDTINLNLLACGAQGIGALNHQGKIADYSSTRKSIFTPHYEKGDLCIETRDKGYNFTGGTGIDIAYSQRAKSLYQEIDSLKIGSDKIENTPNGCFYKGIPVILSSALQKVYPAAIIRNGTSWSTPRRVGEYTKYEMFKDII